MSEAAAGSWTAAGSYEIRVHGHLAGRWQSWFDGVRLTQHEDGTTVIHALLADQAALHGLLRRVSDLGLPLVSVALSANPSMNTTDPPTRRSTT